MASGEHISEVYIIRCAAGLFKGEALDRWLSLQVKHNTSNTWVAFERSLKTEFILVDYERTVCIERAEEM